MATNVNIGGDTTGLDSALQKAQQSVGKATAGIGRGIATAVGSSLGPFGELIEKADMFRQTLSGASMGTKLLAGGVGAAFAAASYLVIKASEVVENYNKQLEINKRLTDESKEDLAKFNDELKKNGVETQNVGVATDFLLKKREALVEENKKIAESMSGLEAFTPTDTFESAIAANLAEIKKLEETILAIREKSSQELADQSAFQRNLSDDAKKLATERGFSAAGKTVDRGQVEALRSQAQAEFDAGISSGTREGAQRANSAAALLQSLDSLLKAIPENKQAQGQRFAELASIGGASALPGIASRQDATKDIPKKIDTTNSILKQILDKDQLLN